MEEKVESVDEKELNAIQSEEDRTPDPAELKSASDTDPKKLMGAVLAKFKEHGYVQIRSIGPAAIGHAVAACDMARSKLVLNGVNAIYYGYFWEIKTKNGERRTGHTLVFEDR